MATVVCLNRPQAKQMPGTDGNVRPMRFRGKGAGGKGETEIFKI
jgi:hypothetical protein